MTIKEDFPDRDAPLRAPDKRELDGNTLGMALNPTDDKMILMPIAFRQVAPRKKALISCIFSFVVLSAHSTVALPGRGNTSPEESNASTQSVLRLTTSTKERIDAPSWNQLSSQLSEGAFQVSKPDDWLAQCVRPFADLDLSDPLTAKISNYQLLNQPSGMCMVQGNCAYKECEGPFSGSTTRQTYNSAEYTDHMLKTTEGLDLPDVTVHPIHVGDISEAIKFAVANKIEISVKTSGHTYTGASMKAETILINLSKLKKYSPNGSIVECKNGDILEGASEKSCDLAIARGKTAFVRVGGGEIFDELLQAVSLDWNENTDNSRKYHVVSGAAGTVSAAGGWLASGGLAGNNDMRSFGVGVDQVLHVEMVLPSGLHVRFGPTDWEKDTDMMYPRTTAVTGYCNNGDLFDEDRWAWEECSKDINFLDLWFAVRGGGGGTYGVITSIYYQLHEYSPMQIVLVTFTEARNALVSQGRSKDYDDFVQKWIEFVLIFFFDPISIGVTESASNHCSSMDAGGFVTGVIVCFDGAGDVMKDAWVKFSSPEYPELIDFITVGKTKETWAAYALRGTNDEEPGSVTTGAFNGLFTSYNNGTPVGRLSDCCSAPNVWKGPSHSMMFPQDVLITKRDKMITMLFNCVSNSKCSGKMYIMGGKIPAADDGMNSLPPHRRHGAFLMAVSDPTVRTEFHRLFNNISEGEIWTGESFPGTLCHNHATLDFPTPLKEDWALTCDPDWPKEEREEKCMSFQETAWGTDTLAKLERIHTSVDPDRLFRTDDGAGYALPGKKNSKVSKKGAEKDKSKSIKSAKKLEHSKKVKKVKNTKSAKDSNPV